MNTLVNTEMQAKYDAGYIIVTMPEEVEIKFPIKNNKRLATGSPQELSKVEISPYGLHWPDLDEDLSFQGLLKGDYGQNVHNLI